MNKTVAIITTTLLFALIGLLAGYMAIRHLTGEGSGHDALVMTLALLPVLGGAVVGFVVGYLAT